MLFLVGIFLGLITGIIPGVGGTVALALILPFVMKLDAAAALPLVIGLISPVLTSDSIPAILIGAPGSASAAATMMDGFPMAKRGEAGRALGIAFTASRHRRRLRRCVDRRFHPDPETAGPLF